MQHNFSVNNEIIQFDEVSLSFFCLSPNICHIFVNKTSSNLTIHTPFLLFLLFFLVFVLLQCKSIIYLFVRAASNHIRCYHCNFFAVFLFFLLFVCACVCASFILFHSFISSCIFCIQNHIFLDTVHCIQFAYKQHSLPTNHSAADGARSLTLYMQYLLR